MSEEPHCHEFIEIVYVLSGAATERVDESSYEVERGDVIFINYGSHHAYEPWCRDRMEGREAILSCLRECKKYV